MILFYYMSLTMENLWEKMDYTYMEHHIMLLQLSKRMCLLLPGCLRGSFPLKKLI